MSVDHHLWQSPYSWRYGSDEMRALWGERGGEGNYWSDYLGWDQDGDGRGDRPYRVDSFHASLLYRYPSAALLLRSPALELLGRLQERLPTLRVPTIREEHPAMVDPVPREAQ